MVGCATYAGSGSADGAMTDGTEKRGRRASEFDDILYLTALACLIVIGIFFVTMLVKSWGDDRWIQVVFEHFAVTVCLPLAAMGAIAVVSLFRHSAGEVKFELLGLRFEGASGPIVMWVFCFLAISLAISLLWGLPGLP